MGKTVLTVVAGWQAGYHTQPGEEAPAGDVAVHLSPARYPDPPRLFFRSPAAGPSYLGGACLLCFSVLMTRRNAACWGITLTKRAIRSLIFEIEMFYLIHDW